MVPYILDPHQNDPIVFREEGGDLEITLLDEIGEGAFCKVYKSIGVYKKDGSYKP